MGKKKQGKVTLSLNDFLGGEAKPTQGPKDVALPSAPARLDEGGDGGGMGGGYGRQGGYGGGGGYGDQERAPREPAPIPDRAPFKIFIGNLDRDCTEQEIIDFFAGKTVLRFHAVNDRETMQFRGFGYVEFSTRDELVAALEMTGQQLMGRGVRIDVAAQSDRDTQQADERTNKAWRTGGGGGGFDQREPESDRATDSPWRRNDGGDRYGGGGGGRSYNDRGGDRYGGGGDRYGGGGGDGYGDRGGDRYGGSNDRYGDRGGDRYGNRGGDDRYGGGSDRYGGGGGGSGGGWRGSGGDSYGSRDDGPSERPKLKIAPRTKPVESSAPAAASGSSSKSNPFGAAKPIDTAAKEAEIERRLAEKAAKDAPREADKDVKEVTEGVAKVDVSKE